MALSMMVLQLQSLSSPCILCHYFMVDGETCRLDLERRALFDTCEHFTRVRDDNSLDDSNQKRVDDVIRMENRRIIVNGRVLPRSEYDAIASEVLEEIE